MWNGDWVQIDIDDDNPSYLNTSILNAMKNINLDEENIPESILTSEDLSKCIAQFERAYDMINNSINPLKPNSSYNSYKNSKGVFEEGTFINDAKQYMKAVENFTNILSGAFDYSAFSVFLTLRPDIISSEYENFSIQESYNKFLDIYKVLNSFDSIASALTDINDNVLVKFVTKTFNTIKEDLTFEVGNGDLKFKNVLPIKKTSDDFIKSNHSNGSIDAIQFSYDINSKQYNYLTLNSKYGNQLGKLLFDSNHWENLKQKISENSKIKMFDSKWDSTLVFWTKFNSSTDTDRTAILSFTSGTDKRFRFSIKPFSYASISMSDENGGDSSGNLSSAELKNSILGNGEVKSDDRYSWVMWSIKFDNSTKYKYEENIDNNIFRHLFGLNVTTYTFEKFDNINGYNIVKHNLNVIPMDDTIFNNEINDLKESNYIWEPFIGNPLLSGSDLSYDKYDSQFDNFIINIGYSKEPSIDGFNTYNYDGYFRNLTFFKGHLSSNEEISLFKLGILNNYEWPSDYENEQLSELIKNGTFFLGLVSIYDSNNINIINCESKYDGITYKIENND